MFAAHDTYTIYAVAASRQEAIDQAKKNAHILAPWAVFRVRRES